jgi:hypothetical protein
MGLFDRFTNANALADVIDIDAHRPHPVSDPVERRAQAAPANVDRAITASAQRVTLMTSGEILDAMDRPYAWWQSEAWEYYDAIGEIKYGYGQFGSIMSRIRLYPAVAVDPDAPPTSTMQIRRRKNEQTEDEIEIDRKDQLSPPEDITDEVMDYMDMVIDSLNDGPGGIAGLIKQFTLNISVAGECFLIRYQGEWSIRSSQELTYRASDGLMVLKETRSGRAASGEKVIDPRQDFVARIWKMHPRFSREPDSTMIALREPCDELLTLQRMIRGIARSRMNAGILKLPNGITIASTSVAETVEDEENENEQFLAELFDVMTTPITNENAGSSVVPWVLTGEAEDLKALDWLSMARESDKFLIDRLDKALDRILNGMDLPRDLITGFSNVKYNNAVQVDNNMYNSHVEPLAVMLCDAITSVILRAAVREKFPNLSPQSLRKIVTWYDPTEVVLKPDPAESATQGYELETLSAKTWRRAHGFADTDAPTQAEMAMRVVSKLTNFPPELSGRIVYTLFPKLFEGVDEEDIFPKQPEPQAAQPTNGQQPEEPEERNREDANSGRRSR